ncbi:hypothetical protein F5888DRAFT_1698339 [Russula emetica]|nr:hypothetical protein F5888DRAFT_1698339 [Russula emetica]
MNMNIFNVQRSTPTFWTPPTQYTPHGIHAPLSTTPSIMSIFSRASLIIIAISVPVLAIRDPGYNYYPSYYTPNTLYRKDSPPNRNDHLGGAKISLLELNQLAAPPVQTRPTYAPPAYAPLAYHHNTANPTPIYHTPTVPTIPQRPAPVVRPSQPHNPLADTQAHMLPTDNQADNPPAHDQAYERPVYEQTYRLPVYNHAYRPPVDTPAYKPLAENAVSKLPIPLTTPTETATDIPAEETTAYGLDYSLTLDEPTPPKQEHGKPSPLPHILDRRNAPRVPRQKIGKAVKGTTPRGRHARRFPVLKKKQVEQRTMVPVTVNMLTGVGPAPSTSSAPTTTVTNALPPSQSPITPGIKVDNSQTALSLHSNPEATTPSGGESTPPISYKGGQQNDDSIGEPRNKATVIASVLSIMLGLVVIITIVKLTSNAMRKRKHAGRLGQYEEHLGSKEGLIPEMSDQAHFETHNVIITRPDGSQISPLSSSRGDSPFSPPFHTHVVGGSPSPLPMPTFAPPPVPASPLSMSFVKLLSPTANLAQQNLAESRESATSETMSMSTTSTDMSDRERPPTSDDEYLGRQVSHRRMRSAPGSVVWSARSSRATGKMTSGLSGEEGYWDSVDVCGSESRMSRGRSAAMSVMW